MKKLYLWTHKVMDYGNAGEEIYSGTKEDCENWIEERQQTLSDNDVQYILEELDEPLYVYIDLETGKIIMEDQLGTVEANEE